ncbi:uncharacterized protein F5147DRAFT_650984 [Suillus discolor]|uniref:Uncharacterized protein n=1 Tax=Suillus discolor TaxID=1912936 RepID=A0A9P7FAJ6_9AGAM|nr:uncharacterized protein F5147DRAFT_650984 [Suillus discolor]KAG2112350.1 hypothetical protein F5147DRAFT_650984 [Suillus discolor]
MCLSRGTTGFDSFECFAYYREITNVVTGDKIQIKRDKDNVDSKTGERETGDGRRETGDGRRETGDGRRETGDGRRETGDGRRETGDGRRETGDGRRETGDGRREDVGDNWEMAQHLKRALQGILTGHSEAQRGKTQHKVIKRALISAF